MATRFLDKEYGADSSTAIADDATGRAKVKDLPDAAGIAFDTVDGKVKVNAEGTIKAVAFEAAGVSGTFAVTTDDDTPVAVVLTFTNGILTAVT